MGESYFPYPVAPIVRWHLAEGEEWGTFVRAFGREEAAALWRALLPVELPWYGNGVLGAG